MNPTKLEAAMHAASVGWHNSPWPAMHMAASFNLQIQDALRKLKLFRIIRERKAKGEK